MYYLFVTPITSAAEMPKILAEDTGVAELRHPMLCAKTEFKLPGKRWLRRKKSASTPCTCNRSNTCPAYC